MPLKGLIHPTEDELTFADLDDVANHTEADMKVTGTQLARVDWENVAEYDWGYYQPFALSTATQQREREDYLAKFPDPKISVSTLVKPLRQVVLDLRYDYYETPDKLIDAWAGTVLHAELAKHGGEDAEKPVSTLIEGVTLCGKPDQPECDFKDTKIFTVTACLDDAKGNQPEYYWQLQIYRWLMVKNGIVPGNDMYLLLRAKDYSDTEKERRKSYPDNRVTQVKIEPEDASEFIVTRIKQYLALKELPDDELPMCEERSRWPNKAMLSFLNNNSNKATGKAFNRCRFYCSVADKCSEALSITRDELSGIAEPEPPKPVKNDFDYMNAYDVCVKKFGKEAVEALYEKREYKGHPTSRKEWLDIHNWLKEETNG